MGHACHIATLGYAHHITTRGYVCHIATFGNVCHIATFGNVCHIVMSGYARTSHRGDMVIQIVMTGLCAQYCDIRKFGAF